MYAVCHRAHGFRAAGATLAVAAGLLPWLAPGGAYAQQQKVAPPQIRWQDGPVQADLGNVAQIQVPEGFKFTGIEGTKKVMELMGNPPGQKELGMLLPDSASADDQEGDWFILFEFDPIGYVKDEDQKNLSAEAIATILDSIRRGNDAANEERKRRGWSVINVVGWEQQPAYDPSSHNLVWAIRGSSQEGGKQNDSVNYNTRILGREGVLSANLVVDPGKLRAIVPTYQKLIKGVTFKPGKSYAEMRAGDKIAEYGLIGLITGGVGAVAVKTGFFTKFLKPILVGIVVAFGAVIKGIKSFFGKLTGSAGGEGA
jgi:uncharacterized membrane-anchored protein